MAEKGILVADAGSGESVACRDAVETDNDGNARIIQRVDVCKGKGGVLPSGGTPYGLRLVNAVDSKDIETEYASARLISIGDKSTLVVFVDFELDQDQSVDITPVIFNAEATPECIGILETKTFSMTSGNALYKGSGSAASGSGSGSGLGSVLPSEGWTGYQMAQCKSWDVLGAYNIMLHITSLTQTSQGYLAAWGYAI